MPAPGELKTACLCVPACRANRAGRSARRQVQARILKYAQEIGWNYVPRAEAERRRGFGPDGATPQERARKASPFFGDLLHAQVRVFNPKYKEAEGALIGASVLWPETRALSKRILSNTSTALLQGDYVFSAKTVQRCIQKLSHLLLSHP